jgi:hypothetical protein
MNINDIITQQGIIYDRYLGSTLSLPYSSFDYIKIQPNETVTNFNINNIISKLYTNYLFLYKAAHVASNLIPINLLATVGVSAGSLSALWYQGLSSNQYSPLSTIGYNFDTSNVLSVQYNNPLNQYVVFTTTGSSLLIFNCNNSINNVPNTFSLALSTNQIYSGSNINWQQIQDITFGDNNWMYVLDISANIVTLFDASGFLTNNNVLQNILVYQNSVGGYGSFIDDTKFNSPNSIMYYKSQLYVLDAGNSCIKKFDRNLNWLLTYRLFADFLSAGPVQINYDYSDNIYVLNSNWTAYKYNTDFTSKQILDFTPLSGLGGTGETIKRLVFSTSDANVFYVVTSKNIYKKLVDYPDDTVGRYLLTNFNIVSGEQITAFNTLSTSNNGTNYDYNFVLSNYTNAGKINLFNDNLNVTTILTNNIFDVYPLSAITISPDEYLQNWVINKSISKLLINHMRLRDNISSKFLYQKSNLGDVLLAGSRYLLPNEIQSIYFQQDVTNFIGANEIFQNNIINRPFETIFNIQTNLLSALAPDARNYYAQPQIVYLT